jgi:ergothioneine biosynthesis protein EgtB
VTGDAVAAAAALAGRLLAVRAATDALAAPLEVEDQVAQSMPDASPVKWHLAHTTWFFETFLLEPHERGFRPFREGYRELFNSYYVAVGPRALRPERGLVTRPTVAEVGAYRRAIDARVQALLRDPDAVARAPGIAAIAEVGLHHEQQHQELVLTDLLHLFSRNPLHPAYRPEAPPPDRAPPLRWLDHPGGLVELGHDRRGFAYDNEGPRHRAFLAPFRLASRLVTNGEWLAFVRDGGYGRPELWLSDGFAAAQAGGWRAPPYWEERDGAWHRFTLHGLLPLDPEAPVCHVSHYEADAYARWKGARLPAEGEWEVLARESPGRGAFVEDGALVPRHADGLLGAAWIWTASPHVGYPGFRPAAGALGEYNGKFMANQVVLRGGSCLSPRSHLRVTYRNFFPPQARWQATGVRLAADPA